MSEATPIVSLIDASATLRIVTCAQCGILFALPASLHLQRANERGLINCPNGHSNKLEQESDANLHVLNALLLDELNSARTRLQQVARAKETPPAIDAKDAERRARERARQALMAELEDRARQLAADATATERRDRWRVCHFCTKLVYFNAIECHYRKVHADDLAALPAERFQAKHK